jgi:hypothetical protein
MVTCAWTGGSTPPVDFDGGEVYKILLEKQIKIWVEFWGDAPDGDVMHTFQNRAMMDAWATHRANE